MKTNEIIAGLRKLCEQGSQYRRTVCRLAADRLEERRWIPVTERLPAESHSYLCYWRGHTRVCKYWRTRECFEFNGRPMKVTHWMPLPQPPKEDV